VFIVSFFPKIDVTGMSNNKSVAKPATSAVSVVYKKRQ